MNATMLGGSLSILFLCAVILLLAGVHEVLRFARWLAVWLGFPVRQDFDHIEGRWRDDASEVDAAPEPEPVLCGICGERLAFVCGVGVCVVCDDAPRDHGPRRHLVRDTERGDV